MTKLVVETALRFLREENHDEKNRIRNELADALDFDESFTENEEYDYYCRPKVYCKMNGIEIPDFINDCDKCMPCYIYMAKEIVKRNYVKYD